MDKLTSKEILIKYTKLGLDGLKEKGETISEELNSISFEDIKALSSEEFNAISLSLLYDWAHITGKSELQDEITKLANRHMSLEDKLINMRKSPLYDNTLEEILKAAIDAQSISAIMIQRLFSVSYPKARHYVDTLEQLGFIEQTGCKYKVLVSK